MKVEELLSCGISKEAVEILKNRGIKELYPPQKEAVLAGVLELKKNFLISIPTASGKTLIAELLIIKALGLNRGKKALYIVPLKALASEKHEEFRKWEKLGFKVALSTGDYDSSDVWLKNYDIIIATSEKVDSLLRHGAEWIEDVKVLVVDEVHLIGDSSRGPTLEVTIARMRHLIKDLLILALSATIKNAEEIARWLNAEMVESEWRPVVLREGVYFDRAITFNDDKIEEFALPAENDDKREIAIKLALDAVLKGGQCLVFLSTRRHAESFALDVADAIAGKSSTKSTSKTRANYAFSSGEKEKLREISEKVLNALEEPTRTCKKLSECVAKGAAFHHAGLVAEQRKSIEQGFRNNYIKVITSTPTLAMGVNLPARRVIVKDYTRYDDNFGNVEISVLEYKQMAGRAGRPDYDDYGEALLIAKSENEKELLLYNYVLSKPEEIYSKLAVESALRMHVLASIAMNYANSFYAILEFFSKTFFAVQRSIDEIESKIEEVVRFLVENEFVRHEKELIIATPFGKRVSELYIDPRSAVILREAIEKAAERKTKEISYLHAVARTGEIKGMYLKAKEYEKYEEVFRETEEYLLINKEEASFSNFEELLSELKLASFLLDWMEEKKDEELMELYGTAPGDIRARTSEAEWMLYAMAEIAKLFGSKKVKEMAELRTRMKYGIKKELLELISLSGIGRVRARLLYSHGFRNFEAIRRSRAEALEEVPTIGEKLAKSLKEQVSSQKT